ncbi:McrB family protein [Aerosakkonemataceae cyanobacterium BLCC-F154]|uniref:McrB family protein n=1 Tax=Floridaenema fluviatile BLCC-F154 TaxID=3153640 RepID=A0ABV4YBS6_9CYAN
MLDKISHSGADILTWSNLDYIAELAFCEIDDQLEIEEGSWEWIEQAWEIIIQAGMASYSTEIEHCQVVIRFLALFAFYIEFYGMVCGKDAEFNYLVNSWEETGITTSHIRQLVWSKYDNNQAEGQDNLNVRAIQYLANNERKKILAALVEGFGNLSMLFVSLWQSSLPEIEEDNREYGNYETDDEIVNYLTNEELAVFKWLFLQYEKYSAKSYEDKTLLSKASSTLLFKETWLEQVTENIIDNEYSFSLKTFEFTAQLHKEQTQNLYSIYKEQFIKYVEKPFLSIFFKIVSELPKIITERLDIERKILHKPPRNLYYEISWYPKGAKLSDDAHLFISLGNESLNFGFFIGAVNPDNERFLFNCCTYPEARELLIKHDLANNCTLSNTTLYSWLHNPGSRKQLNHQIIRADFSVEKYRAIHWSPKELSFHIAQKFEEIFPLILLATSYDPMPAIREFLGWRNHRSIPVNNQITQKLETSQPKPNHTLNKNHHQLNLGISSLYFERSLTEIWQTLSSKDQVISKLILRRYYLALKTRKFVILSGISGTGKTWLTKVYADAIEAEYLLVPVAPNWTTNEDLLGYFNPIDKQYHYTAFSSFLKQAAEEYKNAQAECRTPLPYHIVLDEMNLARVEYYFAKFLSAMEVRMRDGLAEIELAPHETVLLPPNLYFIGTVNMDETTHGFADKVYDRAQLIELEVSRQDLYEYLGEVEYREILMQIWDKVHEVAPFAFRVLNDIKTYVREAAKLNISWEEALDEQLLQKILPKLKGTDERLEQALNDFIMIAEENSFPLSLEKAKKMLDKFNNHGFTSYF